MRTLCEVCETQQQCIDGICKECNKELDRVVYVGFLLTSLFSKDFRRWQKTPEGLKEALRVMKL